MSPGPISIELSGRTPTGFKGCGMRQMVEDLFGVRS